MTPQIFFKEIVSLYHKARIPLYKSPRIKRGESRPVPSQVEDLFAKYLDGIVPENIEILVAPIITFKINNKDSTIKPDICLLRNNVAFAFYDLKMDLGYKRNEFFPNCEKYYMRMGELKSIVCQTKDGISKNKRKINISKSIRYYVPVISNGNISKSAMNDIVRKFKKLKNSKLYILSTGKHPNTYHVSKKQALEGIIINENEFKKLDIHACRNA